MYYEYIIFDLNILDLNIYIQIKFIYYYYYIIPIL